MRGEIPAPDTLRDEEVAEMTVKNVSQKRESFHVNRRVVVLEPNQSVEVQRMTEPELEFLLKRNSFEVCGSVSVYRFRSFRDIEEKGTRTFGGVAEETAVAEDTVDIAEEAPENAPEAASEETPGDADTEAEGITEEAPGKTPEELYHELMSAEYTYSEVRELAKEKGVSAAGSRDDIAKRIAFSTVDEASTE